MIIPIDYFILKKNSNNVNAKKNPLKILFSSNIYDLYFQGERIPASIDNSKIYAQFQVNDKYLLFASDETPFEPWLDIYLIDKNHNIIDHLILTCHYLSGTIGFLDNLTIINHNQIFFTFFNNKEKWILTIHDKPVHRFSFFNFFPFVKYRFLAKFGGKRFIDLTDQSE